MVHHFAPVPKLLVDYATASSEYIHSKVRYFRGGLCYEYIYYWLWRSQPVILGQGQNCYR